jgi:hypothetical protein
MSKALIYLDSENRQVELKKSGRRMASTGFGGLYFLGCFEESILE